MKKQNNTIEKIIIKLGMKSKFLLTFVNQFEGTLWERSPRGEEFPCLVNR